MGKLTEIAELERRCLVDPNDWQSLLKLLNALQRQGQSRRARQQAYDYAVMHQQSLHPDVLQRFRQLGLFAMGMDSGHPSLYFSDGQRLNHWHTWHQFTDVRSWPGVWPSYHSSGWCLISGQSTDSEGKDSFAIGLQSMNALDQSMHVRRFEVESTLSAMTLGASRVYLGFQFSLGRSVGVHVWDNESWSEPGNIIDQWQLRHGNQRDATILCMQDAPQGLLIFHPWQWSLICSRTGQRRSQHYPWASDELPDVGMTVASALWQDSIFLLRGWVNGQTRLSELSYDGDLKAHCDLVASHEDYAEYGPILNIQVCEDTLLLSSVNAGLCAIDLQAWRAQSSKVLSKQSLSWRSKLGHFDDNDELNRIHSFGFSGAALGLVNHSTGRPSHAPADAPIDFSIHSRLLRYEP